MPRCRHPVPAQRGPSVLLLLPSLRASAKDLRDKQKAEDDKKDEKKADKGDRRPCFSWADWGGTCNCRIHVMLRIAASRSRA